MNLDIAKTENPNLKVNDVRARVRRRSEMSIDLEFLRKDDNVLINKVQLMLLGNYHTQGSK